MKSDSRANSNTSSAVAENVELTVYVDTDLIEATGRSAELLLTSRMCGDASSLTASSKRSNVQTRVKELRRLIQRNCRKDPEYLNPRLPVLETAFRLLIVSPKPLRLLELHEAISKIWVGISRPRQISVEALARTLSSDVYYGIVVSAA